ncbi:precorrin-2 C(20)-methyltransferase [Desulfobacterales bacterium HSG17]|nr:precorrin-2 C(20)-methyltransferase [Desulfobacterales bacterium HSG17]
MKDLKIQKTNGILFGIGVGPGDPELLTLKAIRAINESSVIFTASSSKNKYSLALEIARDHLQKEVRVIPLSFPMTRDIRVTRKAWQENAALILGEMNKGYHCAFLTLGDPMTYSTFGYILRAVIDLDPGAEIVTIPGITSYQAAAATMNQPLVEGDESLVLLSGNEGGDRIAEAISKNENFVLLKAYRKLEQILDQMQSSGVYQQGKAVIRCGRPDQRIIKNLDELRQQDPDYWTLIIAKKSVVSDES